LLPTPPHGDAVSVSFGPESVYPTGTSTPLTGYPLGRTSAAILAAFVAVEVAVLPGFILSQEIV